LAPLFREISGPFFGTFLVTFAAFFSLLFLAPFLRNFCPFFQSLFATFFVPFLWASFGLFQSLLCGLLLLTFRRPLFGFVWPVCVVYGPLCELPSSGIFGRSLFVRCASGTSCGSSSVHGIWGSTYRFG
jgi:hypothetical protein